jgi:hypothetical protein
MSVFRVRSCARPATSSKPFRTFVVRPGGEVSPRPFLRPHPTVPGFWGILSLFKTHVVHACAAITRQIPPGESSVRSRLAMEALVRRGARARGRKGESGRFFKPFTPDWLGSGSSRFSGATVPPLLVQGKRGLLSTGTVHSRSSGCGEWHLVPRSCSWMGVREGANHAIRRNGVLNGVDPAGGGAAPPLVEGGWPGRVGA